jgi:hypothetical protein
VAKRTRRSYTRTHAEGRPMNRREAIREKCLDCSAWRPSEVRECAFEQCPLHPFRLGKGKQDPKKRTIAIRKFCLACMNGQASEVRKCPSVDCALWPFRGTSLELPEKRHGGHDFRDKTDGTIEHKGPNKTLRMDRPQADTRESTPSRFPSFI